MLCRRYARLTIIFLQGVQKVMLAATMRTSVLVSHSCTRNISQRHMSGFFSGLKKNLQDELEKNKELKEAVEKLTKRKQEGENTNGGKGNAGSEVGECSA